MLIANVACQTMLIAFEGNRMAASGSCQSRTVFSARQQQELYGCFGVESSSDSAYLCKCRFRAYCWSLHSRAIGNSPSHDSMGQNRCFGTIGACSRSVVVLGSSSKSWQKR